jgi:hypothetical protein
MRPDKLRPTADDPLPPSMGANERDLLVSSSAHRKTIVEFGAGGSTLIFARSAAERIVTIEPDGAWIARLSEQPAVASAITAGRLTFVQPDIGPLGPWGRPTDPATQERWPTYAQAPWSAIDPPTVDLVLVDGRFRVASALAALLHCRSDVSIVFHDFWPRPHYHPVLRWLHVANLVDTLAVLTPLPGWEQERATVEAVQGRFATDPD